MAKKKTAAQENHYDLILAPLVTEKSTMAQQFNTISFEVRTDANKAQIKEAIEAIYGVKVASVNTLIQKGKTKRFRGRPGFRSDRKKAMVTLAPGQSLDVSVGV